MIIRRRKTKAFVTLENTLVRDRRLSLDEHGMLHYLLSLPDDWEVSRHNCAKFWDIGRDKAARIFRSLRKFGWAQVERMHGEDGTFLGVRWIITDEPGAEVPDDVLDRDGEDEGDAPPPSIPAAPATAPNHDTENPCDGSPGVRVTHTPEKAYHGVYIDSKKTDSEENRLPQNGAGEKSPDEGKPAPATFTDLLKSWPPDHVLSRVAAEQAWQHMTRVARQQAFDCENRYLDDCKASSRKVCDLTTYLKEARFERFAASSNRSASFMAKPYSPQWHRWREYLLAIGRSISFMETQAAKGVGWSTQQEWPPPLPPRPEGAPSADAPETSTKPLMTDDDFNNI